MTPEQRALSRRICEAATSGPWDCEDTAHVYAPVPGGRPNGEDIAQFSCYAKSLGDEQNAANARCAAHARTVLPQALDALDEKDAELRSAYFCLGPDYDGEWECDQERRPLDSLVTEALAQKDDEIKRLQALVDRLPKNAVGEPVIPAVDDLYLPFWGKVSVSVTYQDSNGSRVPVGIGKCYGRPYPSRVEAEAAGATAKLAGEVDKFHRAAKAEKKKSAYRGHLYDPMDSEGLSGAKGE